MEEKHKIQSLFIPFLSRHVVDFIHCNDVKYHTTCTVQLLFIPTHLPICYMKHKTITMCMTMRMKCKCFLRTIFWSLGLLPARLHHSPQQYVNSQASSFIPKASVCQSFPLWLCSGCLDTSFTFSSPPTMGSFYFFVIMFLFLPLLMNTAV